jgi:hypothetical protein
MTTVSQSAAKAGAACSYSNAQLGQVGGLHPGFAFWGLAGNPLEPTGKVVSGRNGHVVDGPFAESKQAVGGYSLLAVPDLDEAVAIARGCPGLPYGAKIEVRPVAGECPIAMEARAESPSALAAT